jgi:small nuclear ribonucleoprotein (snRNP)-like protein
MTNYPFLYRIAVKRIAYDTTRLPDVSQKDLDLFVKYGAYALENIVVIANGYDSVGERYTLVSGYYHFALALRAIELDNKRFEMCSSFVFNEKANQDYDETFDAYEFAYEDKPIVEATTKKRFKAKTQAPVVDTTSVVSQPEIAVRPKVSIKKQDETPISETTNKDTEREAKWKFPLIPLLIREVTMNDGIMSDAINLPALVKVLREFEIDGVVNNYDDWLNLLLTRYPEAPVVETATEVVDKINDNKLLLKGDIEKQFDSLLSLISQVGNRAIDDWQDMLNDIRIDVINRLN